MRKYLPAIILLISTLNCLAQGDIGIAYTVGVPLQTLAKHTQPAHQAVFTGNFRLPVKAHPYFFAGIELGIGNYAHKTIEQTFKFSDGTTTRTDVRYNSNIGFANAVFRYDIPFKGRVVPYVNLKGGVTSLFTGIYVEDPKNPDGCEALDKDLAFKDATMTYSYGGGFRINISKQKNGRHSYLLDLGVNNTRGGNVDYLNVKDLGEHDHSTMGGTSDAKPLTTKFINVNTQSIHEHQLAEVYNSPIRILQINLGLVVKFNPEGAKAQKKAKQPKAKKHHSRCSAWRIEE